MGARVYSNTHNMNGISSNRFISFLKTYERADYWLLQDGAIYIEVGATCHTSSETMTFLQVFGENTIPKGFLPIY